MRKKVYSLILITVVLLCTACSRTPKLLDPLGFDENSMVVERGDMYNIIKTENVVMYEVVDVAVKSNAIIKSVDVALGDHVKEGDVLISLDGSSVTAMANEIDEKIASMEKDNAYVNSVTEAKIKVTELEYELLQQNNASEDDILAKKNELINLQNSYYANKIEQEKKLSELKLTQMEAGNVDSQVVAPCDGVVMYLSNWNKNETIAENTTVAIIGREETKVILGDYIEEEFVNSCDEYYALINGKRYEITNNPIDPNMVALIDVFGGILQNRYFINNGVDEVDYGDMVSVIFIKDRKNDVLYIPDEGIYEDVDGYYVYVKDEEGNKVRKDVEVGFVWDTAVEITGGL